MGMWPTQPPPFGPALMTARNLAGVAIPAAVGTTPGSFGPVTYRWPMAVFCTGILLLPLSGDPGDTSKLSLRFQDETAYDVFSTGYGTNYFMPGTSMSGNSLSHYFALQRPVIAGDEWIFTVQNRKAGVINLAGVFFTFMRPGKESDTA
jgi:hypothetical protein